MPSLTPLLLSLLALGFTHAAPTARADTPANNDALIAELITTPTVFKRFRKLLTDAGQTVLTGADLAKATIYDFKATQYPIVGSNGGSTAGATGETMPILIDSGITTNVIFIGPCGVLAPHVHPRANEYFTVVEGEMDFGYITEMGLLDDGSSPLLNGKLTQYTGTFFPRGAIHYQQNPTCNQSVVVGTLSSEDAGTTPYLVPVKPGANATMAKREIDASDDAEWETFKPVLPWYVVEPAEECRKMCGIA